MGHGTGKFANKSSVDVPKPFNHVVDINIGDIDADGKKELIILATQGNSQGKSNFIRVILSCLLRYQSAS